jgi:DNA repair photolyase
VEIIQPGSESKVLKFPNNFATKDAKSLAEFNVGGGRTKVGPIEQKMRLILDKIKDSKFPDNFDWSIYDKIAARYGDEQPRGGVVFNTTLKLVNYHTSCSKCHYAFEIDTYGRGCIHNCIYCYAKDQLSSHGYWNRPMPFPVNMAEVRKIFYTVFETNKPSKWREVLDKRIPLRIGSMSDSFMWMDRKYGVTKELLKILSFYRYPYIIFTRSDLVATQEYMDLLDEDLASVQMSICGGNEELTRLIEPGSPSVKRRLAALKVLNESGFWTTVRINPLFPIYPDGYFTDQDSINTRFGSRELCPKFDLFDWNFVDQLKDAKVPSLLAGFVRLSPWAINNMSRETGIDFKSFFKPEVLRIHGDKHYSDSEIAFYYKKIQADCMRVGIRFNTCYIGNGAKDYYQYQNLWDNKSDCCDAIGNVSAFKTTSQSVDWYTRIKNAPCKEIAEKSIELEKVIEYEFGAKHGQLQNPTITRAVALPDLEPST